MISHLLPPAEALEASSVFHGPFACDELLFKSDIDRKSVGLAHDPRPGLHRHPFFPACGGNLEAIRTPLSSAATSLECWWRWISGVRSATMTVRLWYRCGRSITFIRFRHRYQSLHWFFLPRGSPLFVSRLRLLLRRHSSFPPAAIFPNE